MVPLTQLVLKVHSRCDLACDHCYVYEHADTSWRGRPRVIGQRVLERAAQRLGEHARAHRLPAVHVALHGGEPLLAGPAVLRRAAELLRAELPADCALDLRIHTNGVRLDRAFCELFAELGIKVGLSLDGDRAANDRHRRFADGRSSHPAVLRAAALLNTDEFRPIFAGLLCTIDVRNDPVAVLDALLALDPPRIDFLLPHATWDTPPLRPAELGPTPYGDWLLTAHQHWLARGRPVPVRSFDSVHRTLRGQSGLTESLGLEPVDLVVIETDGSFEQADSLKTAYDGAPATGFDLFTNSLDEVARHPGMMARQQGLAGLSAQCRACPVVRSCGGGLYAHRWRTGSGFDNPSVFCGDLMRLITTIRDRVAPAVPLAAQQHGGLTGAQLDQLARGHGDGATVRALAAEQLDLTRRLLAAVGRGAGQAWELLTELDAAAPAAVDAVLAHPYVRAWAVRRLRGGEPGDDLGGLAEIAAAAGLRAGRPVEVTVPVRGGAVQLPTLGRVLVGGAGPAVLRGGPDGFTVRAAGGGEQRIAFDQAGGERWLPVRRVELPGGWTLALEDTDPQRDSHEYPVEQRLTAAALGDWTGALREAWELIQRDLPDYAPGLAAGLSTLTPLRPGPGGRDLSSVARQAFGAVGIARPATAPTLALLLVHEFQHVKLGAVLDFRDLFDPSDRRLFEAPWRPDPRPLEGLLQGTYAHLAVCAYWDSRVRAYDGVAGEPAEQAREQAARWRADTERAVGTLLASGSLTALGERFVHGVGAGLAGGTGTGAESGPAAAVAPLPVPAAPLAPVEA
ncbi:FxsB family radical SAM/SPASM domain protein [Streptomyces tateyamensis]|uniref:FxsB family radical SAM/SPASM domain protein n=1 Tax=Streptomyces tateyamensis TaxID=565073 RepID=A0A2V4P5V2_9ACTN|nr:FxsB family cyclophane-forming radical SAM/SPASM peptide maturase [Streptomyces tateyamensis]PYC85372.1 FxsB family radical SAM/SPASM domain protein [Streptomyces tateyamensis]